MIHYDFMTLWFVIAPTLRLHCIAHCFIGIHPGFSLFLLVIVALCCSRPFGPDPSHGYAFRVYSGHARSRRCLCWFLGLGRDE
jgi:hypothetical protein